MALSKNEKINEDGSDDVVIRKAESYYKKYRPYMEALEKAPLAKVRSIATYDYLVLGEQLEQFQNYHNFMHENGTAADLGTLPRIALDVITTGYGASVIPILASVQPIEEERGMVYFKQVRAETTKGNQTAGDILTDPRIPRNYQEGYAQEGSGYVTQGNTAIGTTSYGGTITTVPLRPNSIRVEVPFASGTVNGMDDGHGSIFGRGFHGEVNYATGVWTIDFTVAVDSIAPLHLSWGYNYEETGALPKIQTYRDMVGIEAEIFALQSEVGLFKSYSMKKRFGVDAEDDMIADLTNEMVSEVGTHLISRLGRGVSLTQQWSQTPLAAISWADHIITLKSAIAQAERQILDQAGRGVVNQIIAGPNACARLSEVPGFTKSGIVLGGGPQIYGTLDGINIIRAVQLNTNKIILLYKGTSRFDTPIVYAPYMPLYVSKVNNHGITNPLKQHAVAAVWAGIKVVMPQFITSIEIVA